MSRYLLVTADDFGIGLETSRGILDLAARGVVTSTVLLVNSPYAAESVRLWQALGRPVELGWHPCLTLDSPVLPPAAVPSLVGPDGRFGSLGRLLHRCFRGQLNADEVFRELHAQYVRFVDLVGEPPVNVNGHHHIHVFSPIREALIEILAELPTPPFVRRVGETARTQLWVAGARLKRLWLARQGRRAVDHRFPGAGELLGITNPACVHRAGFFDRWLRLSQCPVVELTCHPGFYDVSLVGRDAKLGDRQLERRPAEWEQLHAEPFREAVHNAGFELVTADAVCQMIRQEPTAASNAQSRRAA